MAFNEKEIQEFRNETDGTRNVVHFNNAGASLPPNQVRDAVIDYLKEESEIGGYELNHKKSQALEETYDAIAELINAKRHEVAILENATHAWTSAFNAVDWQPGDEVICNLSDYASNYLSYLHHPAQPKIKVIPMNEGGDEDVKGLEEMITKKTKLVSITHMPTNSGHLAPAEKIGHVCKDRGVLFLLDACQTVGQYPIDVEKIHCDMLSATGRKYLRGPRGTGFLYVSKKALSSLRPYTIDLHSAEWTGAQSYAIRKDARKFENWEGNRANQLGLKVAVRYANSVGLERIWDRVQLLSKRLREKMENMNHVHCHDVGTCLGGIVSFTVDGYSASAVQEKLIDQSINVSWNGRSNTYLDMSAKQLEEIVRCSVHYYNTEEEIDRFIEALDHFVD